MSRLALVTGDRVHGTNGRVLPWPGWNALAAGTPPGFSARSRPRHDPSVAIEPWERDRALHLLELLPVAPTQPALARGGGPPPSRAMICWMVPEPMRVRPGADAITRLEQTFDWMLWISVEERKLIWLRAARVPWKAITFEFGCDRTTAWRRWTLALTKIASRLNAH